MTENSQPTPQDPEVDSAGNTDTTSAAAVAPDPYEGATPPGYDWPTHGGYLGCLLGLIASCLLSAFVGSTLFAALGCTSPIPGDTAVRGCRPVVSGGVAVLLILAVALVIFIVVGRLGFVLGKRFLREYPQPQGRTWGEHDDYEPPVVDADAADSADSEGSEGSETPTASAPSAPTAPSTPVSAPHDNA